MLSRWLSEGLQVMSAWGFTYKTNIVWYKIRKDGGPDGRGRAGAISLLSAESDRCLRLPCAVKRKAKAHVASR